MKTGAVIVAAGMSSRMGDFKPMLKVGAISMTQRIVANFQQAGVFPIVLVTGFRGEELERHVAKTGVICVRNEDYSTTQMFDSARIGFEYIQDKCARTFFSPVDVPLFTASTIRKLMDVQAPVVKPVCGSESGHPILLSCDILPALMSVGSRQGLRKAINVCCADDTRTVDVGDEGILQDADTPEDYHDLVERHNRQLLRPHVEISLMRENKQFDKDGALLLRMIAYTGTVKSACKKMQISYSKAWGLLSTLEENLGFTLIERSPGGEFGGSSRLTERGMHLLSRYEAFSAQVSRYADACFDECFGGDGPCDGAGCDTPAREESLKPV